jgi:hypothetical protein
MFGGSWRADAAIADWTSCAAASRLRESANCSVTWVEPSIERDVIESRPAMVENWRSRGVATDAAIVSGEAPGRFAETWIVGKSTLGRSEIGRSRYAMMPKRRIPAITSVVATGRRTKISDRLTSSPPPGA